MPEFTKIIIEWYRKYQRVLPWRESKDPYVLWLSEIIMQQTRVAQGTPYFYKFIEAFPTVFSLADASETQVLHLWQGLGYYSRARNLHQTAKYLVDTYQGIFPSTAKELQSLKGIGEYTAAAIASFAYKEVVPVIDGNVQRVLARYWGVTDEVDRGKGAKKIKQLALECISVFEPDTYNQGIMEFGALQCTPQNPNCESCPLNISCFAFINKEQASLPRKKPKKKIVHRTLIYHLYTDGQRLILHPRKEIDIWKGLYEPTLEYDSLKEFVTLHSKDQEVKQINEDHQHCWKKVHKLSHQELHINILLKNISDKQLDTLHLKSSNSELIDKNSWRQFPMPIVFFEYFANFF